MESNLIHGSFVPGEIVNMSWGQRIPSVNNSWMKWVIMSSMGANPTYQQIHRPPWSDPSTMNSVTDISQHHAWSLRKFECNGLDLRRMVEHPIAREDYPLNSTTRSFHRDWELCRWWCLCDPGEWGSPQLHLAASPNAFDKINFEIQEEKLSTHLMMPSTPAE